MVFEQDILSCSPREVLIRYLRRALIDILQQVQNGIDSDCISFRLENLIDLLLRSAHLYQDGGQELAVFRATLTVVENCRQSEGNPTIWGKEMQSHAIDEIQMNIFLKNVSMKV